MSTRKQRSTSAYTAGDALPRWGAGAKPETLEEGCLPRLEDHIPEDTQLGLRLALPLSFSRQFLQNYCLAESSHDLII